ncbi:NAD(P)-dependent dehydrogenase (short-subunit alcohol dehydrogenase family) [Hoeflea halophila]|uniref:NAD(P)-dependent dehydrogenase (Short-subunit alcohol dehydrogenase family) n=1 Tax=Hoeflea halophila TaxID=714899 RepID=A0A286IAL0_9HYPH|nr:SDR family oxidoreductase [Hoeflea halophila]SOE17173.1 NAD(P)-dependent dehydrogenase (short-subunit alcohol dehydrogenase family) [Hoeflea halophila]
MPNNQSVDDAVRAQRAVQDQVDAADAASGESGSGAMQAGAREYPVPPFPQRHQRKPGQEHALDPAPMYDAPYYRGSGKLEGCAAIVTGGDSGIGRAVAVLFAREGADVAIHYLSEHEDAETTRAMVENEGRRCIAISGDVRDRGQCEAAIEKTVQAFGRLDVVVNNAAFQFHAFDFDDLTHEHFDETLKTNLYGYFNMCKAALPHLGRGAAILNTGSTTGIDGSGALVDYSMTKGGIHAYTRALASNLMPRGIRVNCIAPGPVWTPLNPSDRPDDQVESFGTQAPMKRPAQPEEIAPAFVFLASPQTASYITGEILPIVGGY